MTWRFRKSVKLFPGVRVNLSRRGISTTVGVRGLSVNVGPRGTYLNQSIPGTGLSSRTKLGGAPTAPRSQSQPLPPQSQPTALPDAMEAGAIKSAAAEELTSDGLVSLKSTLQEAFAEFAELRREVSTAWQELNQKQERSKKLQGSFFARLFRKKAIAAAAADAEEAQAKFDELNEQLRLCVVRVENNFEGEIESQYTALLGLFEGLTRCAATWDKTATVSVGFAERSAAGQAVSRLPVRFELKHIPIIESPTPAMHLMNANGGDIFLYPGFVLMTGQNDFALIDYRDLRVTVDNASFLEEETIPTDSKVTGRTWAKVNKSGSPDLRFKNNYEIPIVLYGTLAFSTDQGLNEVYMFSNPDRSRDFGHALLKYKTLVGSLPGA